MSFNFCSWDYSILLQIDKTHQEELPAAEDLSDPEVCDKYWKYWNIRDQEQSWFGLRISIPSPAWLRAPAPDCNHSDPVSTQQFWNTNILWWLAC